MKAFLLFATLLVMTSHTSAQELFIDLGTSKESLFLGSFDGHDLKVLENQNIILKQNISLKPSRILTGKQFLNQIFKSKLYFHLDGSEPFWLLKLTENEIEFLGTDKPEKYQSIIYANPDESTNTFSIMFRSKNGQIFGIINYLGLGLNPNDQDQRFCEHDMSGESLYEAYLHIDGLNYRGCATIEHQ